MWIWCSKPSHLENATMLNKYIKQLSNMYMNMSFYLKDMHSECFNPCYNVQIKLYSFSVYPSNRFPVSNKSNSALFSQFVLFFITLTIFVNINFHYLYLFFSLSFLKKHKNYIKSFLNLAQ